MQADKGQRRKKQHRALSKIEHTAGFVDQHEADGDE